MKTIVLIVITVAAAISAGDRCTSNAFIRQVSKFSPTKSTSLKVDWKDVKDQVSTVLNSLPTLRNVLNSVTTSIDEQLANFTKLLPIELPHFIDWRGKQAYILATGKLSEAQKTCTERHFDAKIPPLSANPIEHDLFVKTIKKHNINLQPVIAILTAAGIGSPTNNIFMVKYPASTAMADWADKVTVIKSAVGTSGTIARASTEEAAADTTFLCVLPIPNSQFEKQPDRQHLKSQINEVVAKSFQFERWAALFKRFIISPLTNEASVDLPTAANAYIFKTPHLLYKLINIIFLAKFEENYKSVSFDPIAVLEKLQSVFSQFLTNYKFNKNKLFFKLSGKETEQLSTQLNIVGENQLDDDLVLAVAADGKYEIHFNINGNHFNLPDCLRTNSFKG